MAQSRQISMREFSRLAGVSPSTVSRVFSRPDMVNPVTREQIMRLARRKGFRPSPVARAAVGSDTRSIGVLLPVLTVSYFADVTQGIQEGLLAEDYLPVVLSNRQGLRGVQRLVDHRVDGLILGINEESISQAQVLEITGEGFPMVIVDQPYPSFSLDSVLNDDDGGGYQVGKHLAELGHRRVGYVHYGEGTSNCEQRLAGCQRALREVGAEPLPQDIVNVPVRVTSGHTHDSVIADLRQMMQSTDRPTAIFATTDEFARFVLVLARELGLRIPEDLSVVGFADLNFAELSDPPLTTVRQNGEEIGREAARVIMNRLEDPKRERHRVTVPTRLIVRGSTAPPTSR